MGNTVLGVLLV